MIDMIARYCPTKPAPGARLAAVFLAALAIMAGTARAEVVINEIMYHPLDVFGITNDTEYVELYNYGTNAADLTLYRFDEGISFNFPAGAVLNTNAHIVICKNYTAFTNYYPSVTNVIGEFGGGLSDGGERITLSMLVNGQWQKADSIEYYDGGLSDGKGRSLELIHPGFANLDKRYYGDWADSTTPNGTPGITNSVLNTNAVPVIGDVSHDPPVPPPGSCVTITARASSSDRTPLYQVNLLWRIDASPQTSSYAVTEMYDTGLNGDVTPNDGLFTVRLPPHGGTAFTSGQMLDYMIGAVDLNGLVSTSPVSSTAGVLTGPYRYLCLFHEDTGFTGEYPTYRILMTLANRYTLETRGATSDVLLDGTFISDAGEIFQNCGLRYRGGSSRVNPFNYRVELPRGRSYDGGDNIQLNHDRALNQFFGMSVLKRSGYGVLPPKVALCRLWLNTTDKALAANHGIYVRIGRSSETAYEEFGDAGNGYTADGDSYKGDFTYYTSLGTYATYYIPWTNNPVTAWHDLSNLCWNLTRPGPNLPDTLTNVCNIRVWARHFATQVGLDKTEAGIDAPRVYGPDELRFYSADGRFVITPWDSSDLLGGGAGVWGFGGNVPNFLFNHPIAPYYIGDVIDVIDNVMSTTNMTALFDEMGSKLPASGVAPSRSAWLTSITTQQSGLHSLVNTNLTVTNFTSKLAEGASCVVVSSPSVIMSGRAPFTYTDKILVNNAEAAWGTWSISSMAATYGHWSINLNLTGVVNRVVVETIDSAGGLLKSNVLSVVVRTNATAAPGTINTPTVWDSGQNCIVVSSDVTIQSAGSLTINPGTVVLFNSGTKIVAASGPLSILGTAGAPVCMYPSDGSSAWSIEAAASPVICSNAVLVGGRLTASNSATLSVMDSTVSDNINSAGIVAASGAGQVSLTRCVIRNFTKTAFSSCPVSVDRCLLLNMRECGVELSASTGIVRRTTILQSAAGNYANGVRFLTGAAGSVTNCLLASLSSAGVRVESGAGNAEVSHSLFQNCATGMVSSATAVGTNRNNTVVWSAEGLSGGQWSVENAILWSNAVAITSGPASISYSDVQAATNALYAGTGNINRDPFFKDAYGNDYRLQAISPCLTGGAGGSYMGALFPAGANPESPDNLTATNIIVLSTNGVKITWRDNSTDEKWFEVDRSANGSDWTTVAVTAPDATNWTDMTVLEDEEYYYRVRAAHERGKSLFADRAGILSGYGTTADDLLKYLRITEIMYHPQESDNYEFLELKNIGGTPVDLTGLFFTNGIDYEFPPVQLAAGQFYVIAKYTNWFALRYPTNTCNGAFANATGLQNGGERLRIKDAARNTIIDVTYADTWYPTTDGDGYSMVVANTGDNPDSSSYWRASSYTNGSPGYDDPVSPDGSIVINELLTHQDTDNPGDRIELYNAGTSTVNISHWWLSDTADYLKRFKIPASTTLAPGAFITFDEFTHFGTNVLELGTNGFALSELGETLYLSSSTNAGTNLTSYRTYAEFDDSERDVTFGRYCRSDGRMDFTAMSNSTFNASNSYPKIGPVVINEIMYNPSAGGHEFIELLNIAPSNMPLFDMTYTSNSWRLRGAVDYNFPTNTWIYTNEAILVVGIDPDEFRQAFGISNLNIRIFGGFSGDLANNGENVKLLRPCGTEPDGTVPYVLADRVEYDDNPPWPAAADNSGASLERIDARKYGNDPTNWVAATYGGTPGTGNNTAGLPTVAFTKPTDSGYESNTTVYIPVSLYPAAASATVTVDYVVSGGTAENGSDYTLSGGTLVFWPNEATKLISMQVLDNSTPEPDETVIVALTNLSANALMGGNRLFTYTIIDTDQSSLAAPVISPNGGNFYTSVVVTVTTAVDGASIRYTTDGSVPDAGSSLYTTTLVLTASTKLTARTYLGSFNTGYWASASFYEQTPPWAYDPYTIFTMIGAVSDDSMQKGSTITTGQLYSSSLQLSALAGGTKNMITTGLRFNGIGIPKGGMVTNAFIQFTAFSADSGLASCRIYAEATNNPATFTTNNNDISDRFRTSSSVAWSIGPWNAPGLHGSAQRTPQLTNIINEVLARPDWVSGNSLCFIITNDVTFYYRWFYSYDGDPINAPTLYMQFTVPDSAWLSVQTNGEGVIAGDGNQWHSIGSNVTLTASPSTDWHFGGWQGDTGGADTNNTTLIVTMNANKNITGKFDPDLATNNVPIWWLREQYPDTNLFDNAAMSDTDDDGMSAWEEYFCGTIPTNTESVMKIVGIRRNEDGSMTVEWKSVFGKLYSVYRSTNTLSGWIYPPMAQGLGGNWSGTNDATDSFTNSPATFYRIQVEE